MSVRAWVKICSFWSNCKHNTKLSVNRKSRRKPARSNSRNISSLTDYLTKRTAKPQKNNTQYDQGSKTWLCFTVGSVRTLESITGQKRKLDTDCEQHWVIALNSNEQWELASALRNSLHRYKWKHEKFRSLDSTLTVQEPVDKTIISIVKFIDINRAYPKSWKMFGWP